MSCFLVLCSITDQCEDRRANHFFRDVAHIKVGERGPHNMDMFAAIYVSYARVDLGTAGHR